jgi:CAAX prenyl protease-like protein
MTETKRAPFDWKTSLPYVAPFVVFMIFTAGIEPRAGAWYPAVYGAKIVAVLALLIFFWKQFEELRARPSFGAIAIGLGAGIIVFLEWAFVETPRGEASHGLIPPLPLMGAREGYNPFEKIESDAARLAFISVRLFGLALLVPVMEELFWRSWLIRMVVREDFKRVPMGTFTWASCLASAGLFALAHPEWLSAFLCGLAYNFVLYRTKNLWACVVAHATTNLGLGIYVLATGTWVLW